MKSEVLPRVYVAASLLVGWALLVGADGVRGDKGAAPKEKSEGRRLTGFTVRDLDGQPCTLETWKGHKLVVLLFLGTECPVSNGYSPTMTRLATAYRAKGVAVYGVHPDPEVTADAARTHAAEYGLKFPILLDPGQALASQSGVEVVPEAVVVTPKGQVLYRGRVDDRYSPDGRRREEPSTHDLRNAIDAALAGKAPPPPGAKTFGCPLPPPAK